MSGTEDTTLPTASEEVLPPPDTAPEPAPTDTPAEPTPEPAPTPEPPKPQPHWAEKRLAQITAQRHAAEARAAELERKVQFFEAEQARQNPQQPGQQPAPVTQADIERMVNERLQQAEVQRAQQAKVEAFNAVIHRGQADYTPEVFDRACNTLSSMGASENRPFLDALTDLDDAHKVLLYLGTNTDEANRILSLSPTKMVVALARLDVTPKPPAAPAMPVSRAPVPIRPIEGSARVEVDPEKMNAEQFMAWREKSLSKK